MVPKIVAIHSFRRGTGKSTIAANVAALLMIEGHRVGLIDFNFASPSQHYLFGLDKGDVRYTLNHLIWGDCTIEAAVYDVATGLKGQKENGALYLIPASDNPKQVARMLRGGYYIHLLVDVCQSFVKQFDLDVLLIDTYAGLNDEMKLAAIICDTLAVVVRPDHQDYNGTSVVLGVGAALQVPQSLLVINEVPSFFEATEVQRKMEDAFACSVAAVLPHHEQVTLLGSSGVFALQYPDHLLSFVMRQLARELFKRPL